MARRRQIQVDFGPIMSLLNQQYQTKKMYENDLLLQQRAEEANRRLVDREATNRNAANAQADAAAKRAFEREQYAKAQGDPALALKWRNYKSDDPSLDFSKLGDDPTTFLAKQGSRVGSAKTIPDIPSMEGLRSEFQAGTGRPTTGAEALTQMAGAFNRKKGLLAEEDQARERTFQSTPVDLKSIDDQGNEVSNYQTQADALKVGQRATGLTSAQNASRTGAAAGATAAAQQGVEYSDAGIEGAAKKAAAVTEATENAKGPTPDEKSAAQFYIRAVQAHNDALNYEDEVSGLRAKLPSIVQSELAKKYSTARANFITDIVYLQSGKQINSNELDQYDKAWFKQPNDGPNEVAQKRMFREQALEGVKYLGGKGIKQLNKMGTKIPTVVRPGSTLDKVLNNGSNPKP